MEELKKAGDSNPGLFFIQIADDIIPSRTYSTAKLSTPEVQGAAIGLLCGSTPQTVHELLANFGSKGVARRTLFTFVPTYRPSRPTKIRYRDLDIPEELERFRMKELFRNLYMEDTPNNNNNNNNNNNDNDNNEDEGQSDHYRMFKKEVEVFHLSDVSRISAFQAEYLKTHPFSEMDDIVYPNHWVDINGDLKDGLKEGMLYFTIIYSFHFKIFKFYNFLKNIQIYS